MGTKQTIPERFPKVQSPYIRLTDSNDKDDGYFVEGVMFIHPDFEGRIRPQDLSVGFGHGSGFTQEIAKLRRDMHKEFKDDGWLTMGWGH